MCSLHLPSRAKSVEHSASVCLMYLFASLQHICSKCGIWSNSRTCPMWLCRICNEHQEVRERTNYGQSMPLRYFSVTRPGAFLMIWTFCLVFRLTLNRISLSIGLENYLPLTLPKYLKWAVGNDVMLSFSFWNGFWLIWWMNNAVAQCCFHDAAVFVKVCASEGPKLFK